MTIKEHIERVKDEVYKCVHCGFCLTACPTYLVSGLETESPRGRISLMKATIEDEKLKEKLGDNYDKIKDKLAQGEEVLSVIEVSKDEYEKAQKELENFQHLVA